MGVRERGSAYGGVSVERWVERETSEVCGKDKWSAVANVV